jgi:hypothetical protein
MRGVSSVAPVIDNAATTNITNFSHFFAGDIVSGSSQTITNGYAFNGGVTAGTGKWNAYMQGTANNAFLGNTKFGSVSAPTYTVDITGTLAASSYFGVNGATPVAPATGYGTPTGGSRQGSFAAGSITLPNLAAAVAQLIIDFKATGLIAA